MTLTKPSVPVAMVVPNIRSSRYNKPLRVLPDDMEDLYFHT